MNIEEENNGCPFDKVQLYSGSNSQAQTLGQFCGSNPPGKPVVSRAHKMMVKFHSDAKVNEKGFRVRYTAGQYDKAQRPLQFQVNYCINQEITQVLLQNI